MNTKTLSRLEKDYEELENFIEELATRLIDQHKDGYTNAGLTAALEAASAIACRAAHNVALEIDRGYGE